MRISDWSSDVCSSDLAIADPCAFEPERSHHHSSILCLDIMAHRGETVQMEQCWTNARIATMAGADLGLIDDGVVAPHAGRIVYAGGQEVRREGKECGSTCSSRW